jgi:hypothetical protein
VRITLVVPGIRKQRIRSGQLEDRDAVGATVGRHQRLAVFSKGKHVRLPLARALYPNDIADARFASTSHNSLPVEHEAQSELKQRHRIQGLGCN